MTPAARLQRLEAQRQESRPLPVAIVNVCGLTPAEAKTAIDAKRRELDAAHFGGTLVIVDA